MNSNNSTSDPNFGATPGSAADTGLPAGVATNWGQGKPSTAVVPNNAAAVPGIAGGPQPVTGWQPGQEPRGTPEVEAPK